MHSEPRRLLVAAEDRAQRRHDLALRAERSRALDQGLDEVGVLVRRELDEAVERGASGALVAAPTDVADAADLLVLDLLRDLEDVDRLIGLLDEPRDADLDQVTPLEPLLLSERRLGDLLLEVAALDPDEHALEHRAVAHRVDA